MSGYTGNTEILQLKLCTYQVNGQTLGIDIPSWNKSDLNGNDPFIVIPSYNSPPDSGYTDISTPVNWDRFAEFYAPDYLVVKFALRNELESIGWTGLTTQEKDIMIYNYVVPNLNTEFIIHLMTTRGWDQATANGYLIERWHKHHYKVIKACEQRWYYVKKVVATYLNFTDAEDLFDTVESLILDYTQMGEMGMVYGDQSPGIMDYIYSLNGFEGQGLAENNYTLNFGTMDDLIQGLKRVLVDGLYSVYNSYE